MKLSFKDFKIWLKGKNTQEYVENISFVVIIVAVTMLWFGLALGSFVKYTVLLAAFGAFLILPGICIYIASQMMETEKPAESKAIYLTFP